RGEGLRALAGFQKSGPLTVDATLRLRIMARTSRNRSRPSSWKGGSSQVTINGVPQNATVIGDRVFSNTCTDSIGSPVVDSPLSSVQYRGTYPNFSGVITPTLQLMRNSTEFKDFTFTGLPTALSTMTVQNAPSGWLLDLVAGTNPSRPVIGIPIWAQNLGQLPGMLRSLGNLIRSPSNVLKPKGFAGEYLGVQFGWLPLIEDLKKLIDFQSYVLKRNKELADLYSGKGLRRRLKFTDDTVNTPVVSMTATYANALITTASSVDVKRRTWGTIHWYPTTPPQYHPDDHSWNNLTNRLVLGATPEGLAKGLWDVIPWTWLIGWFTNLGKYTLAHSYTVPANHSGGCLMREAKGTWLPGLATVTAGSGKVYPIGMLTRTIKTRAVSSVVTVGVNMPYLDMFRLSILGALFTQRFFR
ncbi:TPA_asm: maturation protein, partial [ssRNA phage Gerhypos.4_48]